MMLQPNIWMHSTHGVQHKLLIPYGGYRVSSKSPVQFLLPGPKDCYVQCTRNWPDETAAQLLPPECLQLWKAGCWTPRAWRRSIAPHCRHGWQILCRSRRGAAGFASQPRVPLLAQQEVPEPHPTGHWVPIQGKTWTCKLYVNSLNVYPKYHTTSGDFLGAWIKTQLFGTTEAKLWRQNPYYGFSNTNIQ